MPIPDKRYSILDTDTNIATSDFLKTDPSKTTNVPKAKDAKLNPIKKVSEGIEKADNTLPVLEGAITSKTDLVKTFMNKLNPDIPVPSKTEIEMLYDHMVDSYYEVTGAVNSVYRNRLLRPGDTNPCKENLNKLLRLLDKLTHGFQNNLDDLDLGAAALLGILKRLLCAQVSNAFSGIAGITSDIRLLGMAGAGYVLDMVKAKAPLNVIDLATVDPNIIKEINHRVPNMGGLLVGTLEGVDLTPIKDKPKFANDFVNALTTLDPSWNDNGNYNDLSDLIINGDRLENLLIETITANTRYPSLVNTNATLTNDETLLIGLIGIDDNYDFLPSGYVKRPGDITCPKPIVSHFVDRYLRSLNIVRDC